MGQNVQHEPNYLNIYPTKIQELNPDGYTFQLGE
jgi:hypothetical protein